MSLIIPANSAVGGGYDVDNSLRFNSGSSDNLTKTFSSSETSNKIATASFWIKRSKLSAEMGILKGDNSGTDFIRFESNDQLRVRFSGGSADIQTNRVFRDISAWYHIVVAFDTTQGTSSNRIKLYINGVQETSFAISTYPALNTAFKFSTNSGTNTFSFADGASYYGGYTSELVWIDGQQLDPTSFGEFDEDSGIWKPIDVSGLTFGTNGFYLDFENSGSLGADVSGNGNNFTVNNLTAIDQSTDTCTNNFATLNPLHYNINNTTENGNLTWDSTSYTGSDYPFIFSTLGATKGKWYVECKFISGNSVIGISPSDENISSFIGSTANSYGYYEGAAVYNNGSPISGYNAYGANSIIGIGLDLDNNKLYFSNDGTWENSGDPESGSTGTGAISLASDKTWLIAIGSAGAAPKHEMNFGNPPYTISSGNTDGNGYGNFEYAVPSGYYALNTKNLSEFG